jgi:hypothetical protein
MNKNQIEDKFKPEVLEVPQVFKDDSEQSVTVRLECGHPRTCKIKSLAKRKQCVGMNVNLWLEKINPVLTLHECSKKLIKYSQNVCYDVNMLDNQLSCEKSYTKGIDYALEGCDYS